MNREHLVRGCWCGHVDAVHRWDRMRDYRELECAACKAASDKASEEN